ncbi:MAG: trypsin-like peptidase domain-containing protein [Oscillospiraceae bacterium]|nr:trypsin-like peptidase domain-containing protein [Oscillospiraceae bacterium]
MYENNSNQDNYSYNNNSAQQYYAADSINTNGSYSYQYDNGTKKEKKKGGKTALLMAGVMVVSTAFGFGGGYLASNMFNTSGAANQVVSGQGDNTSVQTNTNTTLPLSNNTGLSVANVAALAKDSVVEITTEVMTTGMFLQQAISEGAGSGVIYSNDGYIITNNHVIDSASKITVRLTDGTSYDAVLVGTDSQTDIAVIKIEANGLHAATFSDSDSLVVGQDVVAIGNPLGTLGGTVTNGIISALDREITIDGEAMRLLQTNAAVNPGNSGGGLFNANGEIVGIVNAKSSGTDVEGLGFAIPANTAKKVADSLISSGYVTGRPYLGYSFITISNAQMAMQYRVNELGVYVAKVSNNSVMQIADRVISMDGTEVSSVTDIKAVLNNHKVGDTLSTVVDRDGKQITLDVPVYEYVPETDSTQTAAA